MNRVRPHAAGARFAQASARTLIATYTIVAIISVILITAAIVLSSCSGSTVKREKLSVTGGDPIAYLCDSGEKITARYFALSDKSLEFVKLQTPDGKTYTLPLALSASGARYTDERELVWWTKGDTAFVQRRDENGEWQTVFNCREAK